MSDSPLEGPLADALLRVVRGSPTAEELAVLTAVLTALAGTGAAPEPEAAPTSAPALWDRPVGCSPVSWSAPR